MKAAIYCRVSTDSQEREGTSLDTQVQQSLVKAQSLGWHVPPEYLIKEDWTGKDLHRPGLARVFELARTGAISGLIIFTLDRLYRPENPGDEWRVFEVLQHLQDHGITVEWVNTSISKENPFSGVMMFLDSWRAGEERRQIVLNNRSIPTKGAKYNSDKRKLWHSLTIRRMIRNSGYIGNTYFMDTLLPDVTPAIVSEDIFQAANAQLDKPKVRTGRPKNEYLLRNHAFCTLCGKPLVGHCLNKKYRYYQCSDARPYENSNKKCQSLYIRAGDLEEIVWSKTKGVLANPEIILSQIASASDASSLDIMEAEIKGLEKSLRNYEKRRSNLLEAMELDEFERDEILDRLNNLKRLRTEDEAKLNDLLKTRDNLTSLVDAKVKLGQLYDQVLENLENSTLEIKRLALDALDIKVYASTDKVEIQGVIPLELALPTTGRTSA